MAGTLLTPLILADDWRLKKGALRKPSRLDPFEDKPPADSKLFRHIWKCTSRRANSQLRCVPPVVLLLFSSRPSAIFGFVVPKGVDSVKRHSIRTLAHVFQEGFKNSPAFTDSNAARTIGRIGSRLRIKASRQHCTPCLVCRSACFAVCRDCRLLALNGEATARLRPSCPQKRITDSHSRPTITKALRIGHAGSTLPPPNRWLRENRYTSKSHAFQRGCGFHVESVVTCCNK